MCCRQSTYSCYSGWSVFNSHNPIAAYTTVTAVSAEHHTAHTTVTAVSTGHHTAYTTVTAVSAEHHTAYTTVTAVSAGELAKAAEAVLAAASSRIFVLTLYRPCLKSA